MSADSIPDLIQVRIVAADLIRDSIPTEISDSQVCNMDHSWQSWCVGSEDHYEPLIVAYDCVCRPTAGRTSMPGMVVPSGVDL